MYIKIDEHVHPGNMAIVMDPSGELYIEFYIDSGVVSINVCEEVIYRFFNDFKYWSNQGEDDGKRG